MNQPIRLMISSVVLVIRHQQDLLVMPVAHRLAVLKTDLFIVDFRRESYPDSLLLLQGRRR